MKKTKLLITTLLCFMLMLAFCVFASAQETENTYYVVTDTESELAQGLVAEGKQIVAISSLYETEANAKAENSTYFLNGFENETLNLILAENVSYVHPDLVSNDWNCSGVRLEKAITINVYFNGYCWWIPNDKVYSGITINNSGATLNFIGNRTGEEIFTELDLSKYSASNISNDIDFYGGYVGIYVAKGNFTARNAIIVGQDEVIYQKSSGAGGNTILNLENCAVFIKNKGCYDIKLENKNTNSARILMTFDDCNLGRVRIDNPIEGSYVKNSTLDSLELDTYMDRNIYNLEVVNSKIEGIYESIGDSFILIGRNSTFNTVSLKGDGSGGAYAEFYDCTYTSLTFTKNDAQLTDVKSATCTDDGTKTITYFNSTTTTTVDESYIDPAKGHSFVGEILRYSYTSLMENGTGYGACGNCDGEAETETTPIFTSLGYSVNESGEVLQGFSVNHDALSAYGKEIKYGLVVALKEPLSGTDIVTTDAQANANLGGKVFVIDFSSYSFELFEIKVTGLTNDTYKATELYCQAYYVDEGKVYYMNDGVASDTPTATTYNEQKAIADTKING